VNTLQGQTASYNRTTSHHGTTGTRNTTSPMAWLPVNGLILEVQISKCEHRHLANHSAFPEVKNNDDIINIDEEVGFAAAALPMKADL
jgi:hypothetical protein